MKKMWKISSALMVCLLSSCVKPNVTPGGHEYLYGDENMYQKIWDSSTIYNETVVLEQQKDGTISGELIYTPDEIIAVKDYTLQNDYQNHEYRIEGNKIIRTNSSTMPFLTRNNITCKDVPEVLGTYDNGRGGKILFTEGAGILMYQVNVSYTHSDAWTGKIPSKQGERLPNLMAKLQNQETIRLVVNGDSIFTGANASGKLGIEPFQDTFPDGFAKEIKRVYGSEVVLYNTAKGGEMSKWGRDNVMNSVNSYNPDLVIIGFGMNDGSFNINAFDYVDNIEFMVRSIKANNPNAEIICAATILANPNSSQALGTQETYLEPLKEMVESYDGVALLDMTTFSKDLYAKKNSFSLLANNINHPCDFLVRQYVANLMTCIEK